MKRVLVKKLGVPLHAKRDVERLVGYMRDFGYVISLEDMYTLWQRYSKICGYQWLTANRDYIQPMMHMAIKHGLAELLSD